MATSGGLPRNLSHYTVNAKRKMEGRSRGRDYKKLNGAADAEFAHARLECGALHAEEDSGAFGPGDAPLGLAKRAKNVLALGLL